MVGTSQTPFESIQAPDLRRLRDRRGGRWLDRRHPGHPCPARRTAAHGHPAGACGNGVSAEPRAGGRARRVHLRGWTLTTCGSRTFLERHLAVLEAEPEVGYSFSNFMRTEDGVPASRHPVRSGAPAAPASHACRPGRAAPASSRWTPLPPWAPVPTLPGWIQASVFRRAVLEGRRCDPRLKAAEDLFLLLQMYAGGMPTSHSWRKSWWRYGGTGKNSYATSDQIREAVLAHAPPGGHRHRAVAGAAGYPAPADRQRVLRRGWRHFWSHDADRARAVLSGRAGLAGHEALGVAHLVMLPLLPVLPRREPASDACRAGHPRAAHGMTNLRSPQ